MSCICQYFAPVSDSGVDQVEAFPLATDEEGPSPENTNKEADQETAERTVSASDLADCRAENWLLKKKLADYEITIENLEQLVSIIVDKQHRILSEMFQLSKENRELQTECDLQREYHSMERNALMKQLHDVQTLSRNRSLELGRAALEEGAKVHVEAAKESSASEEEGSTGGEEEEEEEEEDTDDDRESVYDSYEDEASAPSSRSSSTGSESSDTDSEADRSLASDSERESDSDSD
ncbi:zinc finger CCHC domain-containing protein 10 [Drosophila pseudoobscura]|uniref:Zinc finger CCHC domain-containing protein 10 n=1 Tax=Drosophila pseudoobscura pseudoobscura TaxID=46245 RepID=A0A6I8V5P3_DROPS|nr:zinc finger CCHC domain-containing protein 10 [Drosophila pseudoobscura]